MTIGRRLPTEWEAKVGTDVNLAGPGSTVASENFLRGDSPAQSTGSIWGNLTMPGIAPTLEARVDAGADQRKVGAALSRSLPIGQDLSVTVRNSYSISQSVTDHEFANAALPLMTSPLSPATGLDGSATWATDQSVRLSIGPSGTAVSAGEVRSSTDDQWHSKFSVEQQLFGPLKVTTSVEDAGSAASKKSITAAFKRVW